MNEWMHEGIDEWLNNEWTQRWSKKTLSFVYLYNQKGTSWMSEWIMIEWMNALRHRCIDEWLNHEWTQRWSKECFCSATIITEKAYTQRVNLTKETKVFKEQGMRLS